MRIDNFGKLVIAILLVSAVILGLGVFVLGNTVSRGQYWVFNAIFSLLAACVLFVVFRFSSKANVEGEYYGVKFSATGAAAGALIIAALMYKFTPPPDTKSIQFVMTQENALYRWHCTIEYQIPPGDNKPLEIDGGQRTVAGIPGGTSKVLIWSITEAGKTYTPSGSQGPPPWPCPIDDAGNVKIDLGPKPVEKVCTPPKPEELKAQLAKLNKLDELRVQVDRTKESKSREGTRSKAILHVENKTRKKINVIGLDCKRLFEKVDPTNLMAADWLDFFEFEGKDSNEVVDFSRFHEMKGTSGIFFLFACVPVPDGHVAVPLGVFDFFQHDESRFKLIPSSGKDQPVVLLPGD